MVLSYQIEDAARSLDQQQLLDWLRGWQVIDPAGGSNLVTAGTGSFEYDAASGDINAGGSTVTCTQGTVDFSTDVDATDDKMAVIYRDAAGALQKNVGATGTRDPAGEDPRSTFAPPPPSMYNTDGVVLAEVLLPAGASSVGASELRDRRLPASLDADSVTALSHAAVGAAPRAGSGLLRVPNDTWALVARNQADGGDINALKVNAADDVETSVPIDLPNATPLQARDAAGSAWVGLLQLNASDQLELLQRLAQLRLANATPLEARNNADNGWVSLLQLNASDQVEVLTRLAQLRLANQTFLQGRNNADTAWVDMWKVNASDAVEATQPVSMAQADVTNETFVRGTRGTANTGIGSNTPVNAFDGESKDVRGEFSASQQFNPDESGEYFIRALIEVESATAGDRIFGRVRNVDGGSNVEPSQVATIQDPVSRVVHTFIVNLTASTNYEIQVFDADSTWDLGTGTKGEIVRSVVA